MQLKKFQLSAVKSLFEAMDKLTRDIILKSPTGSGKTIILTYFMHQYVPVSYTHLSVQREEPRLRGRGK